MHPPPTRSVPCNPPASRGHPARLTRPEREGEATGKKPRDTETETNTRPEPGSTQTLATTAGVFQVEETNPD